MLADGAQLRASCQGGTVPNRQAVDTGYDASRRAFWRIATFADADRAMKPSNQEATVQTSRNTKSESGGTRHAAVLSPLPETAPRDAQDPAVPLIALRSSRTPARSEFTPLSLSPREAPRCGAATIGRRPATKRRLCFTPNQHQTKRRWSAPARHSASTLSPHRRNISRSSGVPSARLVNWAFDIRRAYKLALREAILPQTRARAPSCYGFFADRDFCPIAPDRVFEAGWTSIPRPRDTRRQVKGASVPLNITFFGQCPGPKLPEPGVPPGDLLGGRATPQAYQVGGDPTPPPLTERGWRAEQRD